MLLIMDIKNLAAVKEDRNASWEIRQSASRFQACEHLDTAPIPALKYGRELLLHLRDRVHHTKELNSISGDVSEIVHQLKIHRRRKRGRRGNGCGRHTELLKGSDTRRGNNLIEIRPLIMNVIKRPEEKLKFLV